MKPFLVTMSLFILAGCTSVTHTFTPASSMDPETIMPATMALGRDRSDSPLQCPRTSVYIPVPAFAADNYHKFSFVNGKPTRKPTVWPASTEELNKLLPNIATEITVEDKNAGFDIGIFAKGKAVRRLITMDFMKYRSEPITDSNDKVLMYSRIGAGLRLKLDITTVDGSLGSGGLLAIALSASAGKTKGSISADVIGMDGAGITGAMPFSADLSPTAIQGVLEAMAIVKSKLHDNGTTLAPQFIARIECPDPV